MKALIIVDLQNDFIKGGALAVNDAEQIIPLVNEITHYPFELIIATKDWHPSDHGSFANNHQKPIGSHIKLAGADQILWPAHCVQGTVGSEFAPGWDTTKIDKIVYKGTDPLIDSYSTFFDNNDQKSTGLEIYLKEKGVKQLFFIGLATDYCVKFSVLDALQLGFQAFVVVDACRGVNIHSNDSKKALQVMSEAGAILIPFSDLQTLLENLLKKNIP